MLEVLNKRVESLLSEKGISKAKVSKKLGIGYSTLWRRLNGSRNVNVDFLSELADILETTPSYLMGETDNPNRSNANENALVQLSTKSNEQKGALSFTYWREVFESANDIAKSGDEDAISYVAQVLNKALSLLDSKLEKSGQKHILPDTPSITNSQFIVGNNNVGNNNGEQFHAGNIEK